MRFERLELTAFGKFAGETLAFGASQAGLNVIYGDNEAGKSTALRAIRGVLFGIPLQSQDTFLHAARDVRIGAELSAGSERLAIVRRKGRLNTLLTPSGEPLDEAALRPFLQGVDQTLFDSMFGLNHESLRDGAQSLLALEGKLGETLFEAGFGTSHLRSLLQSFRDQADDIFTARGRSKRLNLEVARVRKAREAVSNAATSPQVYVELRNQLHQHQVDLAELNDEKQRLSRRKLDVELRLRLLPLVAQWRAYGEQRAALGELPLLPLDAEQQAQSAVRHAGSAAIQRDQANREVTRVEEELRRVVVDEAVLAITQGQIDDLTERLGSARKARADLPKRRAEHSALIDEIQRLQKSLGHPPDATRVEEYRLTRDEETQVRRLIRERTQYDTKSADMSGKLKQLETSVAVLKKELSKTSGETNVRPLESALVRAQRYADLEVQLDHEKLQLEATERQLVGLSDEVRVALRAPWNAANTPFTSDELWGGGTAVTSGLVNEYAQQLETLQRQLEPFRAETFTLRERALELSQRVSAMEREAAIPTERELDALRAARDALLDDLEAGLSAGTRIRAPRKTSDEEGRGNVALTVVCANLRREISACDEYATRLRRDADRVAEFRSRQAALDEISERLALREQRERALADEADAVQRRWLELWNKTAFDVGSPTQMATVVTRVMELRTLELTRNEVVTRVRKLERELANVVGELSKEMVQVGEPGRMLWETLAQFVNRLESTLHDRRQQNNHRRDLAQRLTREVERLEQAQREATDLKEASRGLRSEWPKITKRLGVNKDAGPEELDSALNSLGELFRRVDEAQALTRRITGIQRDAEALDEDVRRVASHLYGAAGGDTLELLERILGDHRKQVVASKERARLEAELADRRRTSERASFQLEEAQGALSRLFHLAQVTDSDELFRVISRVTRGAELERLRAEEERRIIAQGEGRGLSELVDSCTGQESGPLQAERARIQDELTNHESRWVELTRLTVTLEQRLNQLGEGAARAAEELESEVAALQSTVRRYLRFKLATLVLETEIERYREANQGPVLGRARELFPRLTLGRYSGLAVGYGSDDQPLLLCTTAEGREVPVEGLSDGTRDQLYLSLRLATLHQYFRTNARMPWVLDDVLVHFDDERSRAALEVLAEFSRDSQVLFFTHHTRTVELARRYISPDQVAIHVLTGSSLQPAV